MYLGPRPLLLPCSPSCTLCLPSMKPLTLSDARPICWRKPDPATCRTLCSPALAPAQGHPCLLALEMRQPLTPMVCPVPWVQRPFTQPPGRQRASSSGHPHGARPTVSPGPEHGPQTPWAMPASHKGPGMDALRGSSSAAPPKSSHALAGKGARGECIGAQLRGSSSVAAPQPTGEQLSQRGMGAVG